MAAEERPQELGLELYVQRPAAEQLASHQAAAREDMSLVPEVDADGDHVHFEMVPMEGDSLLWLTIRRGTTPEVAAGSLRKIADLIDRHGMKLLALLEGNQGSFSSEGEILGGPRRLSYDENGDLVLPEPAEHEA